MAGEYDHSERDHVLELFNDSFARCRRRGDLPGAFYERFLAVPGVRSYFAGTDFARQKRVLSGSLYRLMEAASGRRDALDDLERLARGHAQLGIPADLYAEWLACMLETVAMLDPRFDTDVEAAWRAVLRPGIALMTRHAGALTAAPGQAGAPGGAEPS